MADNALGPVVLGGNVFGWTVEREAAFRIFDAFVDFGGVAIDTADVYPAWAPGRVGGESEQLIGEWLASRRQRQRIKIATKVAKWTKQPGLSAANIRAAVEGSLSRLQTDYVDLYYAHEDDHHVSQEEYLSAFDQLVKEGKVRALGASNFSAERLASALAISRNQGLAAFQFSQDPWSLVERKIEHTLLPTLQKEGLIELPYYSLASGFLSGKYRPGVQIESPRAKGASAYLDNPRNVTLLEALNEIADAHEVALAAVSLSWLRAQPTVGAPIASARTLEHLRPFFESANLKLTADELRRLSSISAPA
jgi:aryl-alcohol dehydrogenase-like predicted oxidoreductase